MLTTFRHFVCADVTVCLCDKKSFFICIRRINNEDVEVSQNGQKEVEVEMSDLAPEPEEVPVTTTEEVNEVEHLKKSTEHNCCCIVS